MFAPGIAAVIETETENRWSNSANPEASHVRVDPHTVLVVIPALNEEKHVADCVRSIMSPPDWMDATTIVVADGGSTDRTREIVAALASEFPNVDLLDNPDRLQSAGINAAVRQRACPHHLYMVRCDAHATYPPGYVRSVVEALEAEDADSVATVLDATGEAGFQRAAAWVVDTPLGSGGSAHRGGRRSEFVDHGHHAGFRLDSFRRIGGYDGTFTHNEDAEYDVRLARAGGRIWLDADIRLQYVMRPTLPGLARQYWNYGRGRARTIAKHRIRPRIRQLLPALNAAVLAVSICVGLVWPPAFAWSALYCIALTSISFVGCLRLKSVAGLFAGPALGAMQLGWGFGFLRQCGHEIAESVTSVLGRARAQEDT